MKAFRPEVFFAENGTQVTVGIDREYVQRDGQHLKSGKFFVTVRGDSNGAHFTPSLAGDVCAAIMRAAESCREFNEPPCPPPIPAPTAERVSAEES